MDTEIEVRKRLVTSTRGRRCDQFGLMAQLRAVFAGCVVDDALMDFDSPGTADGASCELRVECDQSRAQSFSRIE